MIYKYNDKNYSSIFEIAKIMYLDIKYFAKAIKSEEFLEFVKSNSKSKYEKINRTLMLPDLDEVLVFKVTYILNPNLSFRFNGNIFNNYEELGLSLIKSAPNFDPYLMPIITNSLISFHMSLSDYKTLNKEIYNQIIEYENESISDNSYSYFLIAYLLSKKKNIIFNNVEYPDLYSFIYYLNNSNLNKETLGDLLSHSASIKAYSKFGKEKEKIEEFIHIINELEKSENKLALFISSNTNKK